MTRLGIRKEWSFFHTFKFHDPGLVARGEDGVCGDFWCSISDGVFLSNFSLCLEKADQRKEWHSLCLSMGAIERARMFIEARNILKKRKKKETVIVTGNFKHS